ncbi:MAG: Helicase-like, partial [Devosia sp.]|nr:Helicase-like [Devosia sp.]
AFTVSVTGQEYRERKLAGRALMKEILTLVQLQQESDVVIASIGSFELVFSGQRVGRDGFHYSTMLLRTGAEHEVELPVTTTPIGAIARLENALANFDGEQEHYRRRLHEAHRRLASYQPRVGEAFALAGELELKLVQLAGIEAELAASADDDAGRVDGERTIAA